MSDQVSVERSSPTSWYRLVAKETNDFIKLWNDTGTCSKPYDGTFFRPIITSTRTDHHSYFLLGDVVIGKLPSELKRVGLFGREKVEQSDIPAIVVREELVRFPAVPSAKMANGEQEEFDSNSSAHIEELVHPLAEPLDYEKVWTTEGSGSKDGKLAIWRPLPPPGYLALGCICTQGYSKPPTEAVRVVHKSHLLPAQLTSARDGYVWGHHLGKGVDGKVSCWMLEPMIASAGLSSGTFLAQANSLKPPDRESLYCLPRSVMDPHAPRSERVSLSELSDVRENAAFADIAEDAGLNCAICFDVLKDPWCCTNGHNFCCICIIDWKKRNAHCPQCRIELKDNETLIRNRQLGDALELMKKMKV